MATSQTYFIILYIRPVLGSDTVIADFASNKNCLGVNDNVLCFQAMASTSKTTKKSEKES